MMKYLELSSIKRLYMHNFTLQASITAPLYDTMREIHRDTVRGSKTACVKDERMNGLTNSQILLPKLCS